MKFSAMLSGLLILAALYLHRDGLTSSQVNASTVQSVLAPSPEPGFRYQLNYDQWVTLLGREAKVTAATAPKRLFVLAGDSLSLWFPADLLPSGVTWLNQGISGETSRGLLRRLGLFDQTQPETILVMIGVNDLLRGFKEQTLLANQRQIIRYLKTAHPQTRIVVQSILPRGYKPLAAPANPQVMAFSDRLATLSNQSIRALNQQLAAIAKEEGVEYLDLYPDFADVKGNLLPELSTDGLHLSAQGYWVWAARLQPLAQAAQAKKKLPAKKPKLAQKITPAPKNYQARSMPQFTRSMPQFKRRRWGVRNWAISRR